MERRCPDRYERPFDTLEAFYRGVAAGGVELGKEHWTISIGVKFCMDPSGSDLEKVMALRRAWTTVRAEYPQIAAIAQGDAHVYRFLTYQLSNLGWPTPLSWHLQRRP